MSNRLSDSNDEVREESPRYDNANRQTRTLSDIERERVLYEWNNTAVAYPDNACIHHLFEEQAASTPEAVALVFAEISLTYQELNKRANQLAHHLRMLGVGPEIRVGLCVERSIEMIVGLLGIMKAGGVYVPLDPIYPTERLAFIVQDVQARILLSLDRLVEKIPVTKRWVVSLDAGWKAIESESELNPSHDTGASDLAYVMYTSGSTGKPKGVLVEHGALTNIVTAISTIFGVGVGDRVLQLVPFSFDVSLADIFMTLTSGATLFLAPLNVRSGGELLRSLHKDRITTLQLPASVLARLPLEELPDLKTLVVEGETCSAQVAARWSKGRRFFNAYGPTETTVYATLAEIQDTETKIPIGRPLPNVQTYILDEEEQPVPLGESGELYIGGRCLARGYLNRPDLTLKNFIKHPFVTDPAARLYRTGDLARYRIDGNIEYLGRTDQQIKIGDFRIEPGEIEAVLNHHHAIRESVVVAREDIPGQKRLVAYLVSDLDVNRVPLQIPCLAEFGNGDVMALNTEDLSVSGACLVGVSDACSEGEKVRVHLVLPGKSEKIWLTGTVEWYHGERVGIQFEATDQEQARLSQSVSYITKMQDFSVLDLRRSKLRVPWSSKCQVELPEGQTIELGTHDLSYEGMCVLDPQRRLKKEDHLRLRLRLPGLNQGIWLNGEIVGIDHDQVSLQFNLNHKEETILHQAVEILIETGGFSITHLHSYLKEKLPDNMIPTVFVIIPALPLTANGKVDRGGLPAPGAEQPLILTQNRDKEAQHIS